MLGAMYGGAVSSSAVGKRLGWSSWSVAQAAAPLPATLVQVNEELCMSITLRGTLRVVGVGVGVLGWGAPKSWWLFPAVLRNPFAGPFRSCQAHAACGVLRARAHCSLLLPSWLCEPFLRPHPALALLSCFSVSDPNSTLCPDRYSRVFSCVFLLLFSCSL